MFLSRLSISRRGRVVGSSITDVLYISSQATTALQHCLGYGESRTTYQHRSLAGVISLIFADGGRVG